MLTKCRKSRRYSSPLLTVAYWLVQALAEETGRLKAEVEELKGDIEGVGQEADTVKKHSQFLHQWRVDAIFRQFTLKAKIRVIGMKLAEMEC